MLVSAIITKAQNLANVPNTSFWSATEQLQDAQNAYETIYGFCVENTDNYFCTPLYYPLSTTAVTATGGTLTSGSPTVTGLSSTTSIVLRSVVTDSGTVVPTGTQVKSIDSTSQVTLSANASGNASGDTLTFKTFTADSNRNFTYILPLPYDFLQLRLLQYQGQYGTVTYFPASRMSLLDFGNTQNIPGYMEVGQNLYIFDPVGYSTYCLWYYPIAQTLATTTDISYPTVLFASVMEYLLAAEIKRKQNQDPGLWSSKASELMAAMKRQMVRDKFRAVQTKNTFMDSANPWV